MGLLNKHLSKAASTPAPTPAQTQAAAPTTQVAEPTAAQLKPVEATVQAAAPAPKKPLFAAKPAVQASAPLPTPVAPTPTPAPVETRAVTTFDPFALITGGTNEDVNNVLGFILEEAEKTGPSFDGPFPMIALGKGNSSAGGKWQLGSNVPPELRAVLPVANEAFTAVFLGYRVYGVAWAEQKAGNDPAAPGAIPVPKAAAPAAGEDKAKPLWKVTISMSDVANIQAAMKAGEAYQFTKRVEKAEKFDGLGHFRPGVEMVFFTINPIDNSPVVFSVKLPDHYTSTQRALESLGRVMAGLGGLKAAPLSITPYSTEEKGAVAWSCHSIRIEADVGKKGQTVWAAFQGIKEALMSDEDFSRDFKAWNQTEAEPEALAALHAIAAMAK